jgi:hypothetical protein
MVGTSCRAGASEWAETRSRNQASYGPAQRPCASCHRLASRLRQQVPGQTCGCPLVPTGCPASFCGTGPRAGQTCQLRPLVRKPLRGQPRQLSGGGPQQAGRHECNGQPNAAATRRPAVAGRPASAGGRAGRHVMGGQLWRPASKARRHSCRRYPSQPVTRHEHTWRQTQGAGGSQSQQFRVCSGLPTPAAARLPASTDRTADMPACTRPKKCSSTKPWFKQIIYSVPTSPTAAGDPQPLANVPTDQDPREKQMRRTTSERNMHMDICIYAYDVHILYT